MICFEKSMNGMLQLPAPPYLHWHIFASTFQMSRLRGFFFPCKNVQLKLPFSRIPFRRASFPAVVEFNFHGVTGRATAYVQNSEPCLHALEYLGYISQKWLLKRNVSCSHFRQDKRMRRSYFWKVMVTAWHCKAGTKRVLLNKSDKHSQ